MNCKNDLDALLIDLKSTNINEIMEAENQPVIQAVSLPDYNYRKEDLPVQNAFSYVCGYILKRALETHNNCDTCKGFGRQCDELDVTNLLTHFKAFDTTKYTYGGLQSPPEKFIKFIYIY